MNERIKELAEQCWDRRLDGVHFDQEKFANLVAAHEREECIAIAESKRHSPNFKLASIPPQNGTAVDIANLIRARGEK
jgi:hypothetical protein